MPLKSHQALSLEETDALDLELHGKLARYIFDRWTANKEWRQVARLSPMEFYALIADCKTLRQAVKVMWGHCVELSEYYPDVAYQFDRYTVFYTFANFKP